MEEQLATFGIQVTSDLMTTPRQHCGYAASSRSMR
jgi:hypothetical protein